MRSRLLLFLAVTLSLHAAPTEFLIRPDAPRDLRPEVTVLSPKGNYHRVSQIHNPSLTVYPAPRDIATGTAVIVLPGGGFQFLSIDLEGSEVAAWLNAQGITAFVLKYRLPREPGSTYTMDEAQADGRRAVQLVRSRATEWGVAPDRIGTMGFSAGGRLAADIALHPDPANPAAADPVARVSSRPDFQVLVYGFAPPDEGIAQVPPTFLICTHDDGTKPADAIALYSGLLAAKVPAELHIYAVGGHAYAMRNYGNPVNTWPARLREWMDRSGLLPRPSSS